jgi:translation initiation factor IF-2
VQIPAVTPAPLSPAAMPAAPAMSPPPAAASAPRPAPQPDTKSAPPAQTVVVTPPAAPLRKSLPPDKPAEASAADVAPRSADSIEAEVRAALAKVDAAHPAKPEAKPDIKPGAAPRRDMQADIPPRPAADARPRPAEATTGAVATRDPAPRPADLAPKSLDTQRADIAPPSTPQVSPQMTQPGPQAPMQLAPAAPVEIKSQPVVGVDAAAAPAQAPAKSADESEDKNPFSVFSHYLRTDTSPPPTNIPRPPMPVGQ